MATGDPVLSQDQGPAILEYQNRPVRMAQFSGTGNVAPAPAAADPADDAPGNGGGGNGGEQQGGSANPWAQLDGYGRVARRLARNAHGIATPQRAMSRLRSMWSHQMPGQEMPTAPAFATPAAQAPQATPAAQPAPGLPSTRPVNPYTVDPRRPGFGQG